MSSGPPSDFTKNTDHTYFQSRTIRRELGILPETVSRQGCRRPSAPWTGLQRVSGGIPSFRRIPNGIFKFSANQSPRHGYLFLSLWILVVSGRVTLGVTGVAVISLPGFHHLLPILQSTGHIPIHPCLQFHIGITSARARVWYCYDQR